MQSRRYVRRNSRGLRVACGWLIAMSLTGTACASTIKSAPPDRERDGLALAPPAEATEAAQLPATTEPHRSTPSTLTPMKVTDASTTTTPTATTAVAATTTTTTTEPLPDVFDADCVRRAGTRPTFEQVAAHIGAADPASLWQENGFPEALAAGALVDVCIGNGVDDIDGAPRPEPNNAALGEALADNVRRQQVKLNEIFAGYGIVDLEVDGVSGPRTGQRLCAARLALGLGATTDDMAPGSNEQQLLLEAKSLPNPASTATSSERWVLIDRTCQIMFVGSDSETTFVFPTSTGTAGFETRDQDRAEAFRFNPARENGGWHDSTEFPVGVDNPLNGNLYKPLYFDLGQAIHGANNVPATPASKGCARLSIDDQNALVAWLGLDDAVDETWRKEEMNVTVNVQGAFRSGSIDESLATGRSGPQPRSDSTEIPDAASG